MPSFELPNTLVDLVVLIVETSELGTLSIRERKPCALGVELSQSGTDLSLVGEKVRNRTEIVQLLSFHG
jgi:hypothetical protein